MASFMDYMISPQPMRLIDLKSDKSKLNLKSLTILNVGHLPGRTLFRKDATFGKWAVVYIAGGRGSWQVNGGDIQVVEKGTLFLFRPDATYDYGPDENGYWDEYYFTLEGERITEWINTWLIQPDTVKQVGTDDSQQSKIERIFMLMDSGVPANLDRAALLLESLLYEFMLKAQVLPESNKTGQIASLMDDLSDSLYQAFSADCIAKRHHISLSTLRRIVSEYTGYPLNEYMHRLKIAESKNILLNTDSSVKEIANLLGYKDVFYFSRLFKKFVGVSPLVYRKSI
ncbi:helix-turn-helix domain-containing protein [Paenibacillus eucommiae]|uniref:AraC-like DNA-binding protein n=1 Tax=Paenibacillus eucommiae TaxID=1355755 RepID=A0ABS4IR64_9BACL|nr:helix-turn-helix domain-containing protein [Paenibacillus eucommiae]MBP1990062.1 AraC-like DNA-binding protein [Paenibacillus eucommiae]